MKKILMKTLMVFGMFALAFWITHVMAQGFGVDNAAGGEFGLGWGADKGVTLLSVVKWFINWILGLLSLIALAMSLYGGFTMVTAAGDDAKYKWGFKVLKQAAIGLVVVGLSWIIVSTIFSVIGGATKETGNGAGLSAGANWTK